MLLYLHGPRVGQTIKLQGVQFVDGVAENPTLLKSLERYYGVKDFPPEGLEKIKQPKGQEITFGAKELDQKELAESIMKHVHSNELSINNEHEEEMNNGLQDEERQKEEVEEAQKELRNLIEGMKQELSKVSLKSQKDFSTFGEFKGYVKDITGLSPRGGKQADEIMAQYAKENNMVYGVE